MLIEYKNPLVKLNPSLKGKLLLNEDFALEIDKLVSIGSIYEIELYINSGFRLNSDHLSGAIVTPAKKSCHFSATAIDANLIVNGSFYTSDYLELLLKENRLPENLKNFISEWEALGNRWGGNFNIPDVVHFDDDLWNKNPDLWKILYSQYHDNPAHNF